MSKQQESTAGVKATAAAVTTSTLPRGTPRRAPLPTYREYLVNRKRNMMRELQQIEDILAALKDEAAV